MTRDELKAIEAIMREDIKRECEANGISVSSGRIRNGAARTAKRKMLLGELAQIRTTGLFQLTRWADHGVSYEMLKAAGAWISPDRQRKPFCAKIR